MREQLLDYLLGALEPTERTVLEERLGRDRQLRRELDLLRNGLEPLNDEAPGSTQLPPDFLAPPPGLAARTCNYVAARSLVPSGGLAPSGGWRGHDWLVAAGIFLAAGMLLLPGIANSRFNARLTGCQSNLRQLGLSLREYSDLHNGFFPAVPERGPLAAAGFYAVCLKDTGLLAEDSLVICPSSDLAGQEDFSIPSIDQVLVAAEEEWIGIMSRAGGSFGYGLGYMHQGRYVGQRDSGRSNFPLMADAPHEDTGGASSNHGESGQNVLFEDGHVEFLKSCRLVGCDDHIYQNALGIVAAGVERDDSVIARSAARPFAVQNVLEESTGP